MPLKRALSFFMEVIFVYPYKLDSCEDCLGLNYRSLIFLFIKVVSITGMEVGITTHIDLGTTVLPENTVVNFRKAIICDSTGKQVLVATGSYDTATNKFVTGNGMMNYCLPAATDYKVELYYTSN